MVLYLAVTSSRVRADVVSADAFPGLARRYAVRSVPTTVVNEERSILGAPAEAELVRQIVENPD